MPQTLGPLVNQDAFSSWQKAPAYLDRFIIGFSHNWFTLKLLLYSA